MNIQELEKQIEKLVREHLAACREAAASAVKRAVAAAASGPAPARRQAKKASRSYSPRRSPEELAERCEQLYAAVCATPGETVTALAKQLKLPSRSLQVPMKRLKREGRVRSAGPRQSTRYFPMAAPAGKTRLVAVGKGS